jgi:phage gp46-like protein
MMNDDNFEVPLDNQFILSKHKIVVDNSLKSLDSLESAKKYAKQALQRVMHDEVEINSIKIKRPGIFKKGTLKLVRKSPKARLYVTTKF